MTAAAKAGIGTIVAVSDGASPEVFTAIGEIVSASGPNIQAEEIDVTTLDTAGGYTESIAGLKNGGTLDLEILFTKTAQQTQLRSDVESGTARNYRLTMPTSPNTTATFSGLPLSWSQTQEANAAMSASVSIKISGAITWT